MVKYVSAAAALAPMLMKSARGYGLSPLLRRPMLAWSPATSVFHDDFFRPDFQHNSPKYEISNTNDTFQVAVDVPGVKAEDIKVSLENDGQVLALSGELEEKKENYQYSSKFYQSFTLDPSIKTEEFSANLKDGVLIVSAPKDATKVEEKVQNIPITQNAHAEKETPLKESVEPKEPVSA